VDRDPPDATFDATKEGQDWEGDVAAFWLARRTRRWVAIRMRPGPEEA
jgi:hypothetical protein